ncbi:hypothetical protein SEA_KEELAN_102 [Gordonia phage Keelan]|nr:hypothetical protein SEA_KEELAN_102 [Gordonia phage Keelan]
MVEWLGADDWSDVPVVCVIHRRFLPCRHGSYESPCKVSELEVDVEMVREYQNGT